MLCLAGLSMAAESGRKGPSFLHPLIRLLPPPPTGLPEFLKTLLGGDRRFPP